MNDHLTFTDSFKYWPRRHIGFICCSNTSYPSQTSLVIQHCFLSSPLSNRKVSEVAFQGKWGMGIFLRHCSCLAICVRRQKWGRHQSVLSNLEPWLCIWVFCSPPALNGKLVFLKLRKSLLLLIPDYGVIVQLHIVILDKSTWKMENNE